MRKHNIVIKYQTESDITEYHCNMIISFYFIFFDVFEWSRLFCDLLTIYSSWMVPQSMSIFDLISFVFVVYSSHNSQSRAWCPSPISNLVRAAYIDGLPAKIDAEYCGIKVTF